MVHKYLDTIKDPICNFLFVCLFFKSHYSHYCHFPQSPFLIILLFPVRAVIDMSDSTVLRFTHLPNMCGIHGLSSGRGTNTSECCLPNLWQLLISKGAAERSLQTPANSANGCVVPLILHIHTRTQNRNITNFYLGSRNVCHTCKSAWTKNMKRGSACSFQQNAAESGTSRLADNKLSKDRKD